MAVPNASDIDNALVAKLGADPELLALCPNGVYFGLAPAWSTRFVVVNLVHSTETAVFGGTVISSAVYAVKAVMQEGAGGDINRAAARIHELLEDQPLTAAGYVYASMFRDEEDGRIRYEERDEKNNAVVWSHRGAEYVVDMALGSQSRATTGR
jgi:hypothetical protein